MICLESLKLKAYSVSAELDLNRIAILRGIKKKYTWEEPLVLQGSTLFDVLDTEVKDEQMVFLFSFGSVIFFNLEEESIKKVLTFLYNYMPGIEIENYSKFSDDYEIRIDSNKKMAITDEYVVIETYESYISEIISTVIAKSVALERVEENMTTILDSIESVIDKLEKGKKLISNREHGKVIAKIVRFEYSTISYIMILDRPDTTWAKSDAGELYDSMSEFFELSDRYEILRKKIETINSIVDNFSSMSNSIRGLLVEWIIVGLILFDIIHTFWK